MKKYNVVVGKPDRQDPEKLHWKNVGTLMYFEPTSEKPEPGFILELNMFPTTDFKVFAATEKKTESAVTEASTTYTGGGGGSGGGNTDIRTPDAGDIPF